MDIAVRPKKKPKTNINAKVAAVFPENRIIAAANQEKKFAVAVRENTPKSAAKLN